MKKKLLILTTQQFGYLTDTFKYCEHSRANFDITYLCWYHNRPEMILPQVAVKYVSRKGNLATRNLRLLKAFHDELKKNYDAVFANYTRGISLVKLLNPNKKIIFDIRTLSVNPSTLRRRIYDFFLKFESLFFRQISVISDGAAQKIGVKNYHLLPLGSDAIAKTFSKTADLHLLYVGTLRHRDIIKCVRGFHLYCEKVRDRTAKFTIIGDSTDDELDKIKKYTKDFGLENQIALVGRIPHDQLKSFFEQANVGVSFVPLTEYYDFQPPTKTFEYLLSGFPVIATRTHANEEILKNSPNSILINDDEFEFARAVALVKSNLPQTNFAQIAQNAELFSWKRIVENQFIPLVCASFNE